jgi:tRNA(fMet)-specific endonuclease VapC
MSGNYLLDTNIIIALFKAEPSVQAHLRQAGEVFVSSIALGELNFGAQKSERARENLARIEEFAESNTILDCDAGTARVYGQIKNALRLKGRPLPENDIWIAAIALQHDLTLATRDDHFREIDNLLIVDWKQE